MPPKARRGSKQNEQPPESQSRRNAPECRPTSGATRRRVSPPVGSLPLPPSPPTRAKRGQTASDDDGTESIQSCQPHNGGKKQRVNEPLGLSTSGSSSWPLPQASQNAVSAPNPIATHNTDVPTPGRVTSAPGRALGATTVASSTVSLNRRAQNEGSTAQASQQRQRPNPRAPRTRLTGISPPRTRGGPSNRTISNTNEVITGSTAVVGPRATGRGREEPRTRAKSKRTENRDRGMSTSTRSAVRAALLTKKERIPRKGKSDTDAFSSTVSMDCGAEDARDGGDGGNGGSGSGSGRDRDRKNNEPNRTRKRPCPTQASNDRRRKRTQRARSGSTSSGAAASVSRDALATGEVGLAALLEATTTCGGAFNSGVQPAPAPNTVPGVSTASGGRRVRLFSGRFISNRRSISSGVQQTIHKDGQTLTFASLILRNVFNDQKCEKNKTTVSSSYYRHFIVVKSTSALQNIPSVSFSVPIETKNVANSSSDWGLSDETDSIKNTNGDPEFYPITI